MRDAVVFYLNGQRQEVAGARAGMMLADYLRYERSLPGTKIVCAEGDCGACSVLRYFPFSREKNFYPINSCITTVAQMDGSSLVTVDALAEGDRLTPVQRAMMDCHGSQCGFCTPGFVVALTGLVEKKNAAGENSVSPREAKNALTGNLCRCTGYQPIIDAACALRPLAGVPVKKRFLSAAREGELRRILRAPLALRTEEFSFYAPTTVAEAVGYLRRNPDARLIAAGTDLGVQRNKRKLRFTKLLSLHQIPALYESKAAGKRFRVGARVTLAQLRRDLRGRAPELSRFLDLFASPQIKNVATLAGNVGNASPIADTPPFLLAADARALVAGPRGKRLIPLHEFYLDYRKTALRPGEILVGIDFLLPERGSALGLYKASQRKDLDISCVNAAFHIRWRDAGRTRPKEVRVALGGVAATPVRLPKTEAHLLAGPLNEDGCRAAVRLLRAEIEPISDLRGSAAFRKLLAGNLLEKFFREHLGIAL